jgi:hypothetical protein
MVPVSFSGVSSCSDLSAFIGGVKTGSDWNNGAQDVGVIISSYFTLICGGYEVPVYGVRTSYGLHSFAYVESNPLAFPLSLKVHCLALAAQSGSLLPAGNAVALSNGYLSFQVSKVGSYTLLVNQDYEHPLTVFVRSLSSFDGTGYRVTTYEAGDNGVVSLTAGYACAYFKRGLHLVDRIEMGSHSKIYLEPGAFLKAKQPTTETPINASDWAGMKKWQSFISAKGAAHLKIEGDGFIDLSSLSWHARTGIWMENCSDIQIHGLTINNAPEWTLTCFECQNVVLGENAIFGYRQNSDAYAIVDSADCHLANCFARSGDDLFEVKSMDSNSSIAIADISFESCVAWPDKCRGMGIIHETKRNISGVSFKNSTIIQAPANWQDALGCLVVIEADNAALSAITFSDIAINACGFYPINVSLLDSSTNGSISGITFNHIEIPNTNAIRLLNATSAGSLGGIVFNDIYRQGSKVTTSGGLKLAKEGALGTVKLNGNVI